MSVREHSPQFITQTASNTDDFSISRFCNPCIVLNISVLSVIILTTYVNHLTKQFCRMVHKISVPA